MNRYDYYYKQLVTQAVLDWTFDQVEDSDRDQSVDNALTGIVDGFDVSENHLGADLSVDITQGTGYSSIGERINEPEALTNVDCSVDEYGNPTAVGVPGNERWVSVFCRFKVDRQDPEVDGNGLTVYTKVLESSEFIVHQGAEATIGLATKPDLLEDAILLADTRLINGQTQIVNAGIDKDRRQDWIRVEGATITDLVEGNARDAIETIYNTLDTWATSGAPFTFSNNWFGGNPVLGSGGSPSNVSEALNAIVYDLAKGTNISGAQRVGIRDYTTPLAKISWSSQDVEGAIRDVADYMDGYAGTEMNQLALANWDPFLMEPVGTNYHIRGFLEINGLIVVVSDNKQFQLSDNWKLVGVGPSGWGAGSDVATAKGHAVDIQRYIVGMQSGDVWWGQASDGQLSNQVLSATIGGTGYIRAMATKAPSSNFIIIARNSGSTSIRIGASGITGGFLSATTAPFTGHVNKKMLYLGGSTFLVLQSTNPYAELYQSTDDGDTWVKSTTDPDSAFVDPVEMEDMDYNPNTGRLLVVGSKPGADGRLCYTDDLGTTWTEANFTDPKQMYKSNLHAVKYVGGTTWLMVGNWTYPSSVSNYSGEGIWISHDNGVNFKYCASNVGCDAGGLVGDTVKHLYAIGTDGQVYFVGGEDARVYKSLAVIGI